jgi:Kef-type K+ transport system membrane component KefB
MRKYIGLYISAIALACISVYFILKSGKSLETVVFPVHVIDHSLAGYIREIQQLLKESITHDLSILIIQIVTILAVSRAIGLLFARIGQPTVIGEILAGILLGPTLLGAWQPEFSQFLFPVESLPNLKFISQIGLILFMFVIGMELDMGVLRSRFKDAIFISHVGILFPFTFGVGLAYYLYTDFAPADVPFLGFGLFMGISMSVTAFPVLARIIQERRLSRTRLGILAITTAAIDDITAWCILAIVIAIVKAGSLASALVTIALSVVYVLFMLFVLRPFMIRLGNIYSNRESVSRGIIAMVFITMLGSAWATEIIGIHALFGAFLAGVVMPPNMNFRKILVEKTEDVALVLLLPLFFVFTGLRTQINLLSDASLWKVCALVVAVAIAGKFLGATTAAKLTGQSWRDSFSLGALMNTRGLMELIVLNIGFDLGILSPEIFAMLVVMALFTTFITGPGLSFIDFVYRKSDVLKQNAEKQQTGIYRVLISFGLASSGRKLLRLATQMLGHKNKAVEYKAIHVTLGADVSLLNVDDFERQSFRPIIAEAEKLEVALQREYKFAADLFKEVDAQVQEDNTDLLLLGAGKSLYTGSLLGNIVGVTKSFAPENLIDTITGQRPILPVNDLIDEKARSFIQDSDCDVAVLIDRNFSDADSIFIPVFRLEDAVLLKYAANFARNSGSEITVSDQQGFPEVDREIAYFNTELTGKLKRFEDKLIQKSFLEQQDLMLITYDSWRMLLESKSTWLDYLPSVLIIRNKKT